MLSIGEFSKICAVSTKALRHYDSIGLIKPMLVDTDNNYRYYDISQLNDMLLISRLKRYGFSLQEVDKIIKANDKSYLSACLAAQRILLTKQVEQHQEALLELDDYLLNIERTDKPMNKYEIKIVTTPDMPIVSSRQNMSTQEWEKFYGILYEKLAKDKIAPLTHIAIYHDSEFDPENSDVEIALEIADANYATRMLKGAQCVTLTHNGTYATLSEAYAALMQWIEKNGYTIASPPYDKYILGPGCGKPAQEWVTEIYFPIEKK